MGSSIVRAGFELRPACVILHRRAPAPNRKLCIAKLIVQCNIETTPG